MYGKHTNHHKPTVIFSGKVSGNVSLAACMEGILALSKQTYVDVLEAITEENHLRGTSGYPDCPLGKTMVGSLDPRGTLESFGLRGLLGSPLHTPSAQRFFHTSEACSPFFTASEAMALPLNDGEQYGLLQSSAVTQVKNNRLVINNSGSAAVN